MIRPGEEQMPVSIVATAMDRQASMDDAAGSIVKLEVIWTSASKRAARTIIGLSNGKLDMAHCPTRIREGQKDLLARYHGGHDAKRRPIVLLQR